MGYAFALVTSIAYSIWYIGAGALLRIGGPGVSPLFLLFAIEAISAFLVFLVAGGKIGVGRLSDIKYPILSGLCFVAANYLFFVTIINSGVPAASSFASAEIVLFTALLWITTGGYARRSTYVLGAFVITIGLVSESLVVHTGSYALNFTTIGLGLGIATFAGLATYFYYRSVRTLEKKLTTMFYIQGIQVVVFFILLNLTKGGYPSLGINVLFWPLLVGVGAALFLSFYFETVMMKILTRFRGAIVATGYILSDLQLLPVLFYFLAVDPSSWQVYAPGLVLITIGMALLEWR